MRKIQFGLTEESFRRLVQTRQTIVKFRGLGEDLDIVMDLSELVDSDAMLDAIPGVGCERTSRKCVFCEAQGPISLGNSHQDAWKNATDNALTAGWSFASTNLLCCFDCRDKRTEYAKDRY